ncbi:MAG: GDP-mannose 4,6-dehydratase [Parcubacteria group bacterium]|nr:GDP-mannose 4,6-dehydratase [Parcubacteria group bacterium]|tara:strand:- start:1115 stop:2092 length:978 start_codon:yes stop_codon:yes gene_type:complete
MRILITGITGFAGSHLADYILEKFPEVEIFGIKRWRSKTENIEHLKDNVKYFDCDIKDAHNVYEVIDEIKPDKIFHLAAQSYVPASWEAPVETLTLNIAGQTNMLEAIKKVKSKNSDYDPVILVAGSSEEYGKVYENEVPIKETNPLRPLSPYGVSKVCQDLLGYQYWNSYKIRVIRSRAFNHSGPRRGEVFVDSNFAQQIAKIEKGKQDPVIKVGNLEAKRDFTDVRDIVQAYWVATDKCKPGEAYNMCSGQTHSIQQVLDKLLSLSTNKEIKVEEDPARMRPSDVLILSGDNTKFKEATGWEPKINYLDKTLVDMLNYWRERV